MGFIRKIYREKDINKIQEKIILLGNTKWNAMKFMNYRFLSTIAFAMFIVLFTNLGYLLIPVLTILFYYLFYYVNIAIPIKKRGEKLDREALYFFEVLTLTLESGRNLQNSIEMTAMNIDSELSNEFKKAMEEIKYGKSLMEALESLKRRIPSETINNIILNITQTSVFGNSIIETMNNQIEFLRDKQILEIKGQINKIPNKVSIISVIFVVPLILLLVLGPVLIRFIMKG
ncbi:MAG: type II secretion system F family protein [Bacilli bacterium]|nr:type II secretion system F family protein [Bacilli bacterium]